MPRQGTFRISSRADRGRLERGLSLVEMMVGMTAGLAVLTGAIALAGTQLAAQRQLLLETRLQQDLRAAADVIARDLARAGAWRDAAAGLWRDDLPPHENPFAPIQPASAPQGWVRHRWDRGPGLASAQGFRVSDGTLQSLVGAAWQSLTDPQALHVTQFTVTPRSQADQVLACARDCADGSRDCWPRLRVRLLAVEVEGHPPDDPALQRRLRTLVRLRNDVVEGACP